MSRGSRDVETELRSAPGQLGTRAALLDAVDALVAERGWAACSLQAVARRAGLTTGAVYSAFGSRGSLLAAAMERRTADVQMPGDEADLRAAVTVMARNYWHAGQTPEGVNLFLAQLELISLGCTDPSVGQSLHDLYTRLHANLAADLERRTDVPLSASAVEISQRLIGVLQGLTLQNIAFGGDIPERAFVDAALGAAGLA